MQLPAKWLYNKISAYNTFSSMLDSLSHLEAHTSVTLLQSHFAGFLSEVEFKDKAEQDLVY
jgi:hypothetical protein